MIDINTILTQALTAAVSAAVAEATKPLLAQVQCMDTDMAALKERITALENNPAIGVDTTLERRIAALEGSKQISADAFVTHLDQQEWFWEKLTRKAAEVAGAAALAAIDDHCSDYDHDSYDNTTSTVEDIDVDDFVRKDDSLEDAIRDTVRGMSFEIR